MAKTTLLIVHEGETGYEAIKHEYEGWVYIPNLGDTCQFRPGNLQVIESRTFF